MRKDIQMIAVTLKKLAGIEGKDSDKERISWLESEGDETKVQESKGKGKQKEKIIDRAEEEEEVREQEEENGIKDIEEGNSSFTPVVFSVGTKSL